MIRLQFDPLARRFDIVHQALLSSPLPLRGAIERRLHGDVLTKLELIAVPKNVYDASGKPREYLRDELVYFESVSGGDVELTEPEFELLYAHTRATIDADFFPKSLSREGQLCMDWLDELKRSTMAKPAVRADV